MLVRNELLVVKVSFSSAKESQEAFKENDGHIWVNIVLRDDAILNVKSPAYYVKGKEHWTAQGITDALEMGLCDSLPVKYERLPAFEEENVKKLRDLAGVELASIYKENNAIARVQASSLLRKIGFCRDSVPVQNGPTCW